ncbi:MAG: glycosyltransferase family 2 protein [Patescibacteria group bacterium]|jgi:GT2 family glycosyltransferase
MPNSFSYDVSLVTWNSEKWLKDCLQSIFNQTQKPGKIFITDNASNDKTLEILGNYPELELTKSSENSGYAKAHNLNINKSQSDFILVINPDIILSNDYVEVLLNFAGKDQKISALVGEIKHFQNKAIDTCGLQIKPWRLVKEIKKEFNEPEEVFGISGAIALYRKTALENIQIQGQLFDESFFAYKEDVQLAWRLRWAGWHAFCVPQAKANHVRSVRDDTPRRNRDFLRRKLSYRNHWLLYATSENSKTVLPDLWVIVPAEIFRFLYLLIIDAKMAMSALAEVKKMWHSARTFAKQEKRLLKASELRSKF